MTFRLYISMAFASWLFSSATLAKTFVYCSEGDPSTFNPQLATDGPTFNASSKPIYNRLVEFKTGGTKVVPSLAERWETSKDGKVYTFWLRKDVKFHTRGDFLPTRNFNADDVLFSFERMLNKNHPYHMVGGGTYEYFKSMAMDKVIKSIQKVNSHKIKFILSRPEAPFVANLGMDFASILSAEYGGHLQSLGKKDLMDRVPIGTGPYVFKSYVEDSVIKYTAFDEYFLGRPKIDKLIFSITVDANVRYQKLRANECHLIAEPSPTDIKSILKNKYLKLLSQEGLNVGYVAMNTKKAPFNNVKVRQAINHALDRKSYIQKIYLGHAVQAKNPIPPKMWSYNNKIAPYEFNLESAKRLLAEAGYPKGFIIELWTLPIARPYNPNGKKMGELIQADLKKIGVMVKLRTYKWATYLEKARNGEHQMIQLGWTGDNGDPDNFLHVLLGCDAIRRGSNYARWCNKKFEHLIGRAKVTVDLKTRTNFYQKAQYIFKKQAPWVPIAHAKVFRALRKNVIGYKMSPFGTESFYELDIK